MSLQAIGSCGRGEPEGVGRWQRVVSHARVESRQRGVKVCVMVMLLHALLVVIGMVGIVKLVVKV